MWPQFIEAFIVEFAFVFAVTLVFMIDMISEDHNLVTMDIENTNVIIQDIGKGWNLSNKSLSAEVEQEFNNIVKYDADTIGSINVVDDDFNILARFGEKDIHDSSFLREFDPIDFNLNGFYFSEGESDISFWKTDKASIKMFFSHFFESFGSLNSSKYYNWAIQKDGVTSMWILYKTAIPGVNVAIQKQNIRTKVDMGRHYFMLIALIVIFVFICMYEHYKIVTIILQRRKIQKIINTDSVTGGYNKEYFIPKAAKMIKKRSRRFVVVYLRMEKYRNYTTAYGIKAGENLMEDFYKKLCEFIKKRKELVAHLEKSDFILLLHFDNEELLNIRMQAITQALNDCRPKQHLTFSVGACRINTRVDNLDEKISNAGAAISKLENNPACVLWFDESMREEQIWERRVEDDMDRALANNEFKVYLQPKYSTKKEQLSAAEALVRWIHPEYGFVSPAKFIPIFERNGFITKLDDFMLTEVSKLQAKWLAEGRKLVPISVNVSRAHFSQYDLAEHICTIVDTYKVPHEYIELELTESAFFDDKQILLDTIKKLKSFGFKVSMDDFGAGYSSLNSLKELPLDIIKLDAQFFRDIEDKKRADLIVCDTIKLAKKLGMQIVAEGIETREQVDFLAQQHCDLIQGFYFAKPLPVNEFEAKAFA